ncbi:hypothetical protein [uncultured Chryseobacterium sp.]|uniref:hypothetical protein n=1 Tax=uncultured Chryseobacterium sp. TaxID=259322 RepID=UPI0025E5CBD7|nr:hypothetical protein [uncultured Chryseobacterium sp.]
MSKILVPVLIVLCMASCTTKMNQYVEDDHHVSKRHGKWKEEYSADEGTLVAIGKYRNGEKTGTWKTFLGNKLYEKNKIRKDVTKTKRYYPNGKLMESGQSKLEVSDRERHWFYFGPWKYYTQEGRLSYIKIYKKGSKTDSISMAK